MNDNTNRIISNPHFSAYCRCLISCIYPTDTWWNWGRNTLASSTILWGITNNLHPWSHFWKAFLYTVHISTSRTSFQPWRSFSRTSHRARMSEQLLCDTVLSKCNSNHKWFRVTFVVIDSIIANAQRDAANINFVTVKLLVFTGVLLSNVKLMLVLYATFSVCSSIFLCCCDSHAIPAVV